MIIQNTFCYLPSCDLIYFLVFVLFFTYVYIFILDKRMVPHRTGTGSTIEAFPISTVSCTRPRNSMSTYTQSFNLKLIELYSCHECLWNIHHPNFFNGAVQKRNWSNIAHKLDPKGGTTVDFCRKRIQELRHYDSYLRLQKLRFLEPRKRRPFIPLHLGPWQAGGTVLYLSIAHITKDVPISGCKYDVKHSLELLPKDCFEHAFDFLNKNFIRNECEDGGRKERSQGE